MKPYSQGFRERIVRAVADGMPRAEAARTFQVALSTVKQYVARLERTGARAAGKGPGRPRAIAPAQHAARAARLRAHPDDTVAEHAARWAAEQRTRVGVGALRRAMRRLDWRFKKRRGWPPRGTPPAVPPGARTPAGATRGGSSSSTRAPPPSP